MVTEKKILGFMSRFETQTLVVLRQTLLLWHDYPGSNLLKNITLFIRFVYSKPISVLPVFTKEDMNCQFQV